MTTAEQNTSAPDAHPGGRAVQGLRGNCMGAAVLLIVQFAIGIGINLYVTLPKHKAFFSTVFGQGAVAVHAILALLLLGASIGALVRAIRAGNRTVVMLTAIGLVAILVAAGSGASFVNNGSSGASLSMALATAVAMFSYLAAIMALGHARAYSLLCAKRGGFPPQIAHDHVRGLAPGGAAPSVRDNCSRRWRGAGSEAAWNRGHKGQRRAGT